MSHFLAIQNDEIWKGWGHREVPGWHTKLVEPILKLFVRANFRFRSSDFFTLDVAKINKMETNEWCLVLLHYLGDSDCLSMRSFVSSIFELSSVDSYIFEPRDQLVRCKRSPFSRLNLRQSGESTNSRLARAISQSAFWQTEGSRITTCLCQTHRKEKVLTVHFREIGCLRFKKCLKFKLLNWRHRPLDGFKPFWGSQTLSINPTMVWHHNCFETW